MRLIKYVLVVGVIVFGFAYVNANKTKNFSYKPPTGFALNSTLFPSYFPTIYENTDAGKITVMIPPEIQTKNAEIKMKNGTLNPDFLRGKKKFNEQFGIEDWKVDGYSFSQAKNTERLEISGTYTSFLGVKTAFLEHHYFGKNKAQSILMFYITNTAEKTVERAKASLETFVPNVN